MGQARKPLGQAGFWQGGSPASLAPRGNPWAKMERKGPWRQEDFGSRRGERGYCYDFLASVRRWGARFGFFWDL